MTTSSSNWDKNWACSQRFIALSRAMPRIELQVKTWSLQSSLPPLMYSIYSSINIHPLPFTSIFIDLSLYDRPFWLIGSQYSQTFGPLKHSPNFLYFANYQNVRPDFNCTKHLICHFPDINWFTTPVSWELVFHITIPHSDEQHFTKTFRSKYFYKN